MTTTPERRDAITLDAILAVLANVHRRAVIRALAHSESGELSEDELAEKVIEQVERGDDAPEDYRQRVKIALHHYHLPKLESCGLLVHDADTGQVRDVSTEMERELLALLESYEGLD